MFTRLTAPPTNNCRNIVVSQHLLATMIPISMPRWVNSGKDLQKFCEGGLKNFKNWLKGAPLQIFRDTK